MMDMCFLTQRARLVNVRFKGAFTGNPPEKPPFSKVEFSKKEVLHEEIEILA